MNDEHERPRSEVATRFLRTIQEESKTWELEGKDAWMALYRLGGRRLLPEDAVVLAKRLHLEMPKFKSVLKKKGILLGDFCRRAGLGTDGQYSKELHRLTLAPDKPPEQVGLRRSAAKYRMFMAAMADVLNESRSALANRLMVGTSLHPANATIRDEVEQVQIMLQTIVDMVDREFGLFQAYRETAELKARHAGDGGKCRWPQYELSELSAWFISLDSYRTDVPVAEETPEERNNRVVAGFAAERERAMDASRAFWERPVSRRTKSYDDWLFSLSLSGCLQDDEFFYVPHAYLGFGGGCWQALDPSLTPSDRDSSIKYQKEEATKIFEEYGAVPMDEWNEDDQKPIGQTTSLGQGWAQWHAWIVVYPSPDSTRLMPMIYVPGVLSQNRRNFRHPSSSPATSASRSIILPSLWKV